MTTLEFNALVRQYQGLVYTVCHQLVPDEGDAQDLAQETFLAAWRAIDRCPPGYEKQWLARIASNKAKDYLRSAWVRRVNTPEFPIVKDTTPNMMNPRLYTTSYNKPQGQQFDDTAVLSFIKLQYT